MVKTRHRGDPGDESFERFVTLPSRQLRTRRAVDWEKNGVGSDSDDEEEEVSPSTARRRVSRPPRVSSPPKLEPEEGDELEEEDEEEVERGEGEETRRRSGRVRKYDRSYEEENDDDSEVEQSHRRSTRRSATNASLGEHLNESNARPTKSRRGRGRGRGRDHESENGTGDSDSDVHEAPTRSPRFGSPRMRETRSSGRVPRKHYSLRRGVESEDDHHDVYSKDDDAEQHYRRGRGRGGRGLENASLDMNGDIRRSTRQRKLLYGTFNQSLIEKHVMLCGEEGEEEELRQEPRAGAKRKRYDVEPSEPEEDGLDMYSRVKRTRRQVKRDMYGIPINEETEQNERSEQSSDTSADEEEVGGGGEEEDQQNPQSSRQYYLRQHKPRTNLYEAPPIEPQKRPRNIFRSETPPRTFKRVQSYRSPAHRSPKFRRVKIKKPEPKPPPKKKTPPRKVATAKVVRVDEPPDSTPRRRPAFHGNSSTSSSSSSESDNERRFERRKAKSMVRNRNRCLPMNFLPDDIKSGVKRDRMKVGSSLADVDPMAVDKSVLFDKVGGLGKHIRALKEMIVFPLLYPEIFERFKISPPRGVLFYGPPGTGKTLVARALANECSTGERKVAFFMRKGADCLSKWVGESERQLRLLFDQAYQMRPSIIFFDEIDGLAPVRSSRQDQIHSSIVSTLLALMDGLDNRGEIVVIGATNRLDSIDPALRRPGRFDREFLFPLPNVEARSQILEIQTREWNPKPCMPFLRELAEKCVGYCGADLKALCTEGALHALRRRYPQIYTAEDKLELDVSTIEVSARDFHKAMQNIVPASQRSAVSPARTLDHIVIPLLRATLQKAVDKILRFFPTDIIKSNSLDAPVSSKEGGDGNESTSQQNLELYSDNEDDDCQTIYEATGRNGRKKRSFGGEVAKPFLNFTLSASQRPMTYRPRLLLSGQASQGQSTHVGPAVLHHLERVPVHVLDLPALYGMSSRTPEEACAQVFREARRTRPSIIYMPHISDWWDVVHTTLQATFLAMLQDLQPDLPILLLATSEARYEDLPYPMRSLFSDQEIITMANPTDEERQEFFEDLFLEQTKQPPRSRKQAAARVLEVLPRAKAPEPRELTEVELKKVQKQEEKHLRELRIFLRDILNKLGRDRKFGIFAKPVDTDDVPDYYEIIHNPMDMSTMMSKIDLCQYSTVKDFVDDINRICSNALEYNPDRDPAGRAIRHRACALRDTCNALIEEELDPEFEKLCEEVKTAQVGRGETPSKSVPRYYYTRPLQGPHMGDLSPSKYPSRFSRRTRGMEAEEENGTEHGAEQSLLGGEDTGAGGDVQPGPSHGPRIRPITKRVKIPRSKSYPRHKSPWLKTKNRRFKTVIVYVDEYGNEVDPPNKEMNQVERAKDEEHKEEVKGEKMADEKGESKEEGGEEKESDGDDTLPLVEADEATDKLEEAPTEGSEEKENKPVVPPGSPRSQHASPTASSTPCVGLRASTRSSRSASISTHTGILTRSTSPRSTSPRSAGNVEATPHRPKDASPKTSPKLPEAIQKTPSPRTRFRRPSTRSSHSEPEMMEVSPVQKAEELSVNVNQPINAGSSPASSPHSPVTRHQSAVATPSPPPKASPKTSPQQTSSSASALAASAAVTATIATTAESNAHSPQTKEGSSTPQKSQSSPTNANTEESKEEKTEESEKTPSPKMRMTRSKTQVPAAMAAMAKRVLETEAARTVVIDEDKLRHLLATTVARTKGYNVENLEKLFSHVSQAIYYHREQLDKEELLQDMDNIITDLPLIQR